MTRLQSPKVKLARAVLAGTIVLLFWTGAEGVTRKIEVVPDKACPGQTVLLRMQKVTFKDVSAINVTVAGQTAPVVRVVDRERTVVVMIPRLSPQDGARIRLDYRGAKGDGKVTILPSPLRRVFLRMEDNTVTVERTRPYNGEYDRIPRMGRRLSYDVFGERDGRLRFLYTGAIPHPAERTIESFGPPGDPSPRRVRVPARGPYRFMIKIPHSPGTTVLKLYEAPDTVDLWTAKGRRARRPIKGVEKGIRIGEKP